MLQGYRLINPRVLSIMVGFQKKESRKSNKQLDLGIPLATKKLKLIEWQPLITKITRRISSWTTKKLSYAGRVQLVKSVLFGIQSYWAQLFIIPAKVMKVIEGYCRSFIWSGTNKITRK